MNIGDLYSPHTPPLRDCVGSRPSDKPLDVFPLAVASQSLSDNPADDFELLRIRAGDDMRVRLSIQSTT